MITVLTALVVLLMAGVIAGVGLLAGRDDTLWPLPVGPSGTEADGTATWGRGMSVTWDTVQVTERPMSHDMPCPRCGHALHVFVECGEPCGCSACPMPGARFEPFGVMQSVHPHLQLQRSARS